MFRKSAVLALGLALGFTGIAAAAQGGGILKDPVVSRLGLSEDQLAKVKELDTEYATKIKEAVKGLKGDEKTAKTTELMDELRGKVAELLTEEQKPKYEAGMAVVAEFKAKLDEANAAVKAAGSDKEKKAEASANLKAVVAEMEKALDEKVGPKAAASGQTKGGGKKGGGEEGGGGGEE